MSIQIEFPGNIGDIFYPLMPTWYSTYSKISGLSVKADGKKKIRLTFYNSKGCTGSTGELTEEDFLKEYTTDNLSSRKVVAFITDENCSEDLWKIQAIEACKNLYKTYRNNSIEYINSYDNLQTFVNIDCRCLNEKFPEKIFLALGFGPNYFIDLRPDLHKDVTEEFKNLSYSEIIEKLKSAY